MTANAVMPLRRDTELDMNSILLHDYHILNVVQLFYHIIIMARYIFSLEVFVTKPLTKYIKSWKVLL